MKSALLFVLTGIAFVGAEFVPVLEENYDFIGNDVANVQAGADKCTDLCKANGKCHAYTWSDYNGGTCWLKSGRGDVQFKLRLKSALLTPLALQPGTLLNEVDWIGHDTGHFQMESAAKCSKFCQEFFRCRAFTWTPYENGTCWLKDRPGVGIRNPEAISGVAYPYDQPVVLSNKTDFMDHDIGNQPAASPDLCVDLCIKFPGCHVFAWSKYQGGTCWFKALIEAITAKEGVVAGSVGKQMSVATFKNNTDYKNNDITSVSGISDAGDCIQICGDVKECKFVTWSDYRKGTCWLKSKGEEVEKLGVKAYALIK